jgi:hypothetical protein
MFPEYARGAIEKAEIIPYSNFMNLNVPDQDNACEGKRKILLCVFVVI